MSYLIFKATLQLMQHKQCKNQEAPRRLRFLGQRTGIKANRPVQTKPKNIFHKALILCYRINSFNLNRGYYVSSYSTIQN